MPNGAKIAQACRNSLWKLATCSATVYRELHGTAPVLFAKSFVHICMGTFSHLKYPGQCCENTLVLCAMEINGKDCNVALSYEVDFHRMPFGTCRAAAALTMRRFFNTNQLAVEATWPGRGKKPLIVGR